VQTEALGHWCLLPPHALSARSVVAISKFEGKNRSADLLDAAAFQLVAQKPDLAIMDCMSYTRLEMARVSAILSCLVLPPAVAATQAAAALLAMERMESSVRHSLSDHGPKPGR
jgi:hypothetical protein